MKKFKLPVLGTVYNVTLDVDPAKDDGLENRFGYCNRIDRRIVVADLLKIDDWKEEAATTRVAMTMETLRHEIIHAFLHESGLWASSSPDMGPWALNEEMVDWFAHQWPKINEAFVQAGAIQGGENR